MQDKPVLSIQQNRTWIIWKRFRLETAVDRNTDVTTGAVNKLEKTISELIVIADEC